MEENAEMNLEALRANLVNPEMLMRAGMVAVVGFPLVFILAGLVSRVARRRLSQQSAMVTSKFVRYTGLVVVATMVLQALEFPMAPLLGAAGVVGLALGFASQTSMSNLISGIFLLSEKPFLVGDIIEVGDTMGSVLSVDLLSVKVRAFDNRFIRIPNETLIKSQVTNYTHFPIRRVNVNVGVAYKEDVGRVKEILADIARKNPYCLDEPEPLIYFTSFGDSALEFLFGVWCVNAEFLNLKNSIMQDIKERFDAEGIEIPFPHRTVYTGEVTKSFPVRMTSEGDDGDE